MSANSVSGLPLKIRHLRGEPSPDALWLLFKGKRKVRHKLTVRYFGQAKRGPKAKEANGEYTNG